MNTGRTVGPYVVEIDESGDEVLVLDERASSLPANYREREIELTAENLRWGHNRADLAVSRYTRHITVQRTRAAHKGWGSKFFKDPRPFSSVRNDGGIKCVIP